MEAIIRENSNIVLLSIQKDERVIELTTGLRYVANNYLPTNEELGKMLTINPELYWTAKDIGGIVVYSRETHKEDVGSWRVSNWIDVPSLQAYLIDFKA